MRGKPRGAVLGYRRRETGELKTGKWREVPSSRHFMTLRSIAPLSFDPNLQALDGLLLPSIHILPSDKSVTA